MPVVRVIRHSPVYLYCKFYGLSLLVSLFASRPVTGRLDGGRIREQILRIQAAAQDAVSRQSGVERLRKERVGSPAKRSPSPSSSRQPFPFALKTFASDADVRFPVEPVRTMQRRAWRVLRRWYRRLVDLSKVGGMVRRDFEDVKRFPEMVRTAHVRRSNGAHASERAFVRARSARIARDRDLLARFGIRSDVVHADDIPRLAVGGSGGGYRATFGFLSSLQALHQARLNDSIFWMAGVSGSCWTIAALYTVARRQDPTQLLEHYKHVAAEGLHPMSSRALDVVARSAQGVYFLLGPLLSKLRNGNVGIGIMDMYATLTTSYQLLSRSPHARPRLSRSTFQFSKMWQRCGLDQGLAPMPIFTAVRVVRPDGTTAAANDDLVRQRQSKATDDDLSGFSKTRYQWWEMSPLEVGSSDEGAWVPTWAYGRSFVSGRSVSTAPEISLSMLLGQATSAPAGPLTGYITTLLATLPRDTMMSRALQGLNDFVRHKRWQRRWGNPIRGADEANPLYGFGPRSQLDRRVWEGRGRLKLMDSGLGNNLPNHVFTTAARQADIIVAFDQSSDVKTGAGRARLNEFARERGLVLVHDEEASSAETAVVFRAWRLPSDDENRTAGIQDAGLIGRDADMRLIYCPLLPHPCQPDFDPTTSTFSTSYNLIWKPDEIDTLARTAGANTQDHVVPALRRVYQQVYEEKRARRLGKEMVQR